MRDGGNAVPVRAPGECRGGAGLRSGERGRARRCRARRVGGGAAGCDRRGDARRHRLFGRAHHRRRRPVLHGGAADRRVDHQRRVARFPPRCTDRNLPRPGTYARAGLPPRPGADHRRGDGHRGGAAAAVDDGGDQRRDRQPGGRADPVERPPVPATRAIERRRGDPARRNARRGAAAGRAAAERRRPARRTQHLSARRGEGHRRAVQQPGDQPVGRLHPRVQDPEVDVPAGVRRQGVGAHQRRDQVGRQPGARQRLHVRPRRAVRRTQLLRPARRARAAARSASVRRQPRRPARRRPDVRLRQLRGAADGALPDEDLLGPVGGGARWRFLEPGADLRSADTRSRYRRMRHVLPGEPDSGQPNRSGRSRLPAGGAGADPRRRSAEPDVGRAVRVGHQSVQCAHRSPLR